MNEEVLRVTTKDFFLIAWKIFKGIFDGISNVITESVPREINVILWESGVYFLGFADDILETLKS